MELVCPSCSTVHRTEEHPNAFEIQCVCGYSILVPDESALALAIEPEMNAPASADEVSVISPSLGDHGSLQAEPEAQLNLTPTEQLPEGMVYDPFELPDSQPLIQDEFSDLEKSSESGATETSPLTSEPLTSLTATQRSIVALGQPLVDRTQAASLGQLIGSSYSVQVSELDRANMESLIERLKNLAALRPWLQGELNQRHIVWADFLRDSTLNNVPELIAMEIYLGAFELGGHCTVQRIQLET
jgi:hypothetical protein